MQSVVQCCGCKAGVEGEERRGRKRVEKRRSGHGNSSSGEEEGDQAPEVKKMAPAQSGRGFSNNGNKGLTGDGAWVASTDTGSSPTGVQEIGYR